MSESSGKQLARRAQEIRRGASLERLPTPEHLAKYSDADRHAKLEKLRLELFAVSSLLADAAVGRARRERPSFPPYGLVRSRHSELRMIVANPDPVHEGEVDSFLALGKAYVDTTVFHLHGSFAELQQTGKGWMIDRLEKLLELFKVGATPASRSRMRDPVSFVYGGLQFGTAVCVQLAEVMSTLLDAAGLPASEKAEVMGRSSLPAYDLAACSVTGVLRVYQGLQSPSRRTVSGASAQSWLDPDRFVVREADGAPWRIDLREDDRLVPEAEGAENGLHSYTTLGCPARISPSGATSPIATLWSWCVELALDTGLLGPPATP